jgi:hypothetical protein
MLVPGYACEFALHLCGLLALTIVVVSNGRCCARLFALIILVLHCQNKVVDHVIRMAVAWLNLY